MDISPEDFEALLRRNTDEIGWLQPLLDDPSSAALIQAFLLVASRQAVQAIHLRDALTISDCSGGQFGTTTLMVFRTTGGSGGTIPQGYPFIDSRGVRVVSQIPIVVNNDVLELFIPVITERQTELVNSEDDTGFVVALDAPIVIDSDNIANLIAPADTAGNAVTTFASSIVADPIQGGAVDMLSVHGSERGLPRQPGEGTAAYRARIRNIIDMATPIAIADLVESVAQKLGLPSFLIREPFEDGATPVLKAAHSLSSFQPLAYDADSINFLADFMDDEGVNRETVDRREATAYFEIAAQDFVRDPDLGTMHYDESFYDDELYGYPDGLGESGLPPQVMAGLLVLIAQVAAIDPLGVQFDVFLRDPDILFGIAASSSGSEVLVWDLAPPTGSIWMVSGATAGHDSPDPGTNISHRVVYTLLDGSLLDAGQFPGDETQNLPLPHQPVTRIQGFLTSDGLTLANLVGTFRVLELQNWVAF